MPSRASALGVVVLVALGAGVGLVPAADQQIHRHGFAGKQTALLRGDANVRADEKKHDISDQSFKSQPASEHLQMMFDAGTGDAAFVHYYYETPPAPVSPALSASVWVKATKPGVQLRARVVFPKEPDPARPEAPLTMLVVGKTYERVRNWDKLVIENVPELLGKHLPAVRTKTGRDVNTTGAYIDRLVLNAYTGPGPVDIWVDDLDIGPVRLAEPRDPAPAAVAPGAPGGPVALSKPTPLAGGKGRQVEQNGGQLKVDGKPYFFRAIRHTGTPLHVLRAAGFDSLWLPPDATQEVVDEAGREGWLVIPSAPPADVAAVGTAPGNAAFDAFSRKFGDADVLFWDLGGGLTDEQERRVNLTAAKIREKDRKRPLGGDLWDGYSAYSQYLDVVGAHRWPLFTSLELVKYRDWLAQRRVLIGGRPVFWTWVQNHLPDWYAVNLANNPVARGAAPADPASLGPVGPHPEQVRQLAYISLATGCRGLGFWSDRYLADSTHGRDRLQGMALLNAELDLLSPVLLSAGETGGRAVWVNTSHPHVKAAVISGQKGILVLPIWMGPGDQYVPPQGAATQLTLVVPGVPNGYDPWLVTPAGVECVRHKAVSTSTGTQLTIDEFDTVAPVVFTDDQSPGGLVVGWQDHARRYGKLAARWSLDLAAAEYEKVRATHMKLSDLGVQVRGAEKLLGETHRYYNEAQRDFANELYDKAYRNATRALRPLRVLMRDHWQLAVTPLDLPTASPFAVSFFSLPQHWELEREVRSSRPAASVLPRGDFETGGDIPAGGVRVDQIAGWTARSGSLGVDRVVVAAGVVTSDKLEDAREPRKGPPPAKGLFAPSRPITSPDEGYLPPGPDLGKGVLKLEVRSKLLKDRDGKPVPFVQPLERTFLAVDSPPVRLPPGTLVRVSGWVNVPAAITGTADGALLYDDAGGEPLAVRLQQTAGWKQFHLYRRVPTSGQMSVTLALTGIGVAYYDDVRIEPLVAGAAAAGTATGGPTAGKGRPPVVPASYLSR